MITGGCLGKVDADKLLQMLRSAGNAGLTQGDFVDATIVGLAVPTSSIVTSTDLIYDFGMGPGILGSVAVVHALSDLYACLATPTAATICMGVTSAGLADGSSAITLSHAFQTLNEQDVALGGGHTVYSDQPFLAVSTVGLDALGPSTVLDDGAAYDLVISKPLGSGIYIAALRNGFLTGEAEIELEQILHTSNRDAAAALVNLETAEPRAVGFVTDVTGFGLLQAVQPRLRANTRATISSQDVPLLSEVRNILNEHGIVTKLGDANMLVARDSPAFDVNAVDTNSLLILSDPQTSGGLVAAVRDSARLPAGWFTVGKIWPSEQDVEPKLEVV